jgi:very-short-patch-repair endonuclease
MQTIWAIVSWIAIPALLYWWIRPYFRRKKFSWLARKDALAPHKMTTSETLPYQKKWYLLSPAERDFYDALRQAVGSGYLIFVKLRLLDLLWLPQNLSNRQTHLNRVQAKHVDFVLCHPQTVAPALVIELDDASHRLPDRQERDIFLNEVLRVAGIPLLRVPVRKSFSAPALRGQILDTLGVRSQPETAA